jgi:hypothetical protein
MYLVSGTNTNVPAAGLTGAVEFTTTLFVVFDVTVTVKLNCVALIQVITNVPLYSGCTAPVIGMLSPFLNPCGVETHVAVAVVPDLVMVIATFFSGIDDAGAIPVITCAPLYALGVAPAIVTVEPT